MIRRILLSLSVALALTMTGLAQAQTVDVQDAWVRATVPGQKASGAFMKLTAPQGTRLVGVATPVAGVASVHEMKMVGDIMTMRAVEGGVDLPAGQTVELKPGGYHVMLMDLKTALHPDSTIPLTLLFKDAKGVQSKVDVQVPVRTTAPAASGAMPEHSHGMTMH